MKNLEVENIVKKEETKYIISKQSANTLFNYMRELKYLKMIIENKAIIPRYNEEFVEYLNIGYRKIAFPQTCFCDINLQRVKYHTHLYGEYGIAFYKRWCIKKGIQPIHYINEYSEMCKDFTIAFKKALKSNLKNIEFSYLKNELLTQMLFMKPIIGTMNRDNQQKDYNFHDEREWRYIPNIDPNKYELPQVILEESINTESMKTFNQVLTRYSELWLHFEYDDVKYIIVPNTEERDRMIEIIDSSKININFEDKLKLISKITVLNELEKDW